MSFDYLNESKSEGSSGPMSDGGTIFFNNQTAGERFRLQFPELPRKGKSPGGQYQPYDALVGKVVLVGYGPKGESVVNCGPYEKEMCARYTACPDLTDGLKQALVLAGWSPGGNVNEYDISSSVFEVYRENRKTRNGNTCMHLNVRLLEDDLPF